MEEHRLKPMREGYNSQLFEQIYKDMGPLKRRLASEIDASRFGVDFHEICSWLDVKIIFVFNKHCLEFPPNKLQAFIINALQNYKQRILRQSYQQKYLNRATRITEENENYFFNLPEEEDRKAEKLEAAVQYIESLLDNDGKEVFRADLNPPTYVRARLEEMGRKTFNSIPASVIADYLGWGNTKTAINHVNQIRKEIKNVVKIAKGEFSKNPSMF